MKNVYEEKNDYISVDVMGTVSSTPTDKGFRIHNERGKTVLELAVFIAPSVQEKYGSVFRKGDYVFITKAGLFKKGQTTCLAVTEGSVISLVKRNNDLGINNLESFI